MSIKTKQPVELKLDRSFDDISRYRWINITSGDQRVGKVRSCLRNNEFVIHSIQIFSEFRRQGYGYAVVERCKQMYTRIVADRVRRSAREFWTSVGFKDTQDGNFIWRKS